MGMLDINKLLWGEGPWQGEPDEVHWVDGATGLLCRAVRHEVLGSLCGYVGVPPTHPAYEVHYDGANHLEAEEKFSGFHKLLKKYGGGKLIDHIKELPEAEPVPGVGELIQNIQVHGGLTFAGRFMEEDVWWLGFDCAHAFDLAPGMEHAKRASGIEEIRLELPEHMHDVYRTLSYVKGQCAELARQLHEIDVKSRVKLGAGSDNTDGSKQGQ